MAEKPGEEASGKVQKFDWIGFQVRFACGAFLGALMGWKSWAKAHYRQNFEHDGISLCVCMLIGALLMGTIVGFGWRENFWSRPL